MLHHHGNLLLRSSISSPGLNATEIDYSGFSWPCCRRTASLHLYVESLQQSLSSVISLSRRSLCFSSSSSLFCLFSSAVSLLPESVLKELETECWTHGIGRCDDVWALVCILPKLSSNFELECNTEWPPYIHVHTYILYIQKFHQHSHAMVGLAQACPNYTWHRMFLAECDIILLIPYFNEIL